MLNVFSNESAVLIAPFCRDTPRRESGERRDLDFWSGWRTKRTCAEVFGSFFVTCRDDPGLRQNRRGPVCGGSSEVKIGKNKMGDTAGLSLGTEHTKRGRVLA